MGATGTCGDFNQNSGLYLVERHAMLWDNGVATDLGNLGGTGQNAGHHPCAINNRGQIVGHSDLPRDKTFHTFLWTRETGMRDIGTLAGDLASTAISINDGGTAVGTSRDSSFNPRAFVWESGSRTDLNAVATSNPQKRYMLLACSINARGEIVGVAVTGDGKPHGFLAIPDKSEDLLTANDRVTSPAGLSEEARNLVFRSIGVRRR